MMDIVAIIGAAMAVIGFLSVWIKMGVEKGEHKKTTELLEHKTDKHETEITELKNTTHTIQLDWARSMGRIEAKLDSIGKIEAKMDSIGKIEAKLDSVSESVAALKGGRRAEEK
ncbi:MAG: hypothetical protein LBG91_05370 [Treponema sp.]|jgi:hypothetical protein|nr:hypothetical protein [Treponema sp.]